MRPALPFKGQVGFVATDGSILGPQWGPIFAVHDKVAI